MMKIIYNNVQEHAFCSSKQALFHHKMGCFSGADNAFWHAIQLFSGYYFYKKVAHKQIFHLKQPGTQVITFAHDL